jgi:hypothetical protein
MQGATAAAAAAASKGSSSATKAAKGAAAAAAPPTGVRALLLAPTRELAAQIHREVVRLSAGRKLRSCLLSKAQAVSTVATLTHDYYSYYCCCCFCAIMVVKRSHFLN